MPYVRTGIDSAEVEVNDKDHNHLKAVLYNEVDRHMVTYANGYADYLLGYKTSTYKLIKNKALDTFKKVANSIMSKELKEIEKRKVEEAKKRKALQEASKKKVVETKKK